MDIFEIALAFVQIRTSCTQKYKKGKEENSRTFSFAYPLSLTVVISRWFFQTMDTMSLVCLPVYVYEPRGMHFLCVPVKPTAPSG